MEKHTVAFTTVFIGTVFVAGLVVLPLQAQTPSYFVQLDAIQKQLLDLEEQLTKFLQNEIPTLEENEVVKNITLSEIFTQNLSFETENEEVKNLQKILARRGIYDGPVTGYFGTLTQNAVARFQKKYGIPQVGIVGPVTRRQLNIIAGDPVDVVLSNSLSRHSCLVEPFSVSVSSGETANYTLKLSPSISGKTFNISLGSLPENVSASLSQLQGSAPQDVGLSLVVVEDAPLSSFNLIVVYNETQTDGSLLPNFCQVNLIVE